MNIYISIGPRGHPHSQDKTNKVFTFGEKHFFHRFQTNKPELLEYKVSKLVVKLYNANPEKNKLHTR